MKSFLFQLYVYFLHSTVVFACIKLHSFASYETMKNPFIHFFSHFALNSFAAPQLRWYLDNTEKFFSLILSPCIFYYVYVI
jgi:hypothetical protein